MVKFALGNKSYKPELAKSVDTLVAEIYRPVKTLLEFKDYTTAIDINPNYITPKMLQYRLQKIMDEYVAGVSTWYKVNAKMRHRRAQAQYDQGRLALGHNEPRTITVRDYRKEQGVEKCDEMNREWCELVLKKRSAGPTVGAPSPRSMQLFDMCSYDIDSFREFIQEEGFRSRFDVEDIKLTQMLKDDDVLFAFAVRFLRQVLFGEHSIPFKLRRVRRITERKKDWEKRRQQEIERFRERDRFSKDGG